LAQAPQRVLGALSGSQGGSSQAGVGADAQGFLIAGMTAGQYDELTGAFTLGKRLAAPRGGFAPLIGDNPDLEDPCRDVLQVVLGVGDAAAGAHHLYVAGLGASVVAEVVAVADGALADIGDDFHVAVRMWRKAGAGGDLVVVPDAQAPPVDPLRIMVFGEGEVVTGIEPAVVGMAEAGKRAYFDHGGDSVAWAPDCAAGNGCMIYR